MPGRFKGDFLINSDLIGEEATTVTNTNFDSIETVRSSPLENRWFMAFVTKITEGVATSEEHVIQIFAPGDLPFVRGGG